MIKFFSCFFLISFLALSQKDPVTWNVRCNNGSNNTATIEITGLLEKGWHTYSTRQLAEGPVPTSFTFHPAPFYELYGSIQEIGAHEEYVSAFDAKLTLFSRKALFVQEIKKTKPYGGKIKISMEYMCCNDKMCLPPKTIDLWVEIQ